MKLRIQYYKRTKKGRTYKYPWLGYSYRNEKGIPSFNRIVSLAHLSETELKSLDLSLSLAGKACSDIQEVKFMQSKDVGGAWVVLKLLEQLNIVTALGAFSEKSKASVLAMIMDRILSKKPHSKVSLAEYVPGTGIEKMVVPQGKNLKPHDFYTALDDLYDAQDSIQKFLFYKDETPEQMFLYDITSSYLEGQHCALSKFGYNRDGKKGKKQIVIGLLANSIGKPIAVRVFEGNTADQSTVMNQIDEMRNSFKIKEMVFIGDRGMLTKSRRNDLNEKEYEAIKFITALPRTEFMKFVEDDNHPLQLSLFDRQNIVEVENASERYMLCFNPEKEHEDRNTRERLLSKTEEKLEMIKRNVEKGHLKKRDVIASKYYAYYNKWGMKKFFTCEIEEGKFTYLRNNDLIEEYSKLDGCYVITTDVSAEMLQTKEVVNRYKSLALVEQAFRTMKTTELYLRPIRHWSSARVKGHVFVCMLAYMVIWQIRQLYNNYLNKEQSIKKESIERIWEILNKIQVGSVKIGKKSFCQLGPIPNDAKKLLEIANAKITLKDKNFLEM